MNQVLKSNIYATFRKVIKMNMKKLPKHYKYMYEEFDKNKYSINSHEKYVDLLNKFGKFINKHIINIDCIKKSILDEVNKRHRINALKKIAFSEEEDNADDAYEENDSTNEENEENNTDEENDTNEDDTNEENDSTNRNKHEPNKVLNK